LMSRKEFATDDSRVRDFAVVGFRSIADLIKRASGAPVA